MLYQQARSVLFLLLLMGSSLTVQAQRARVSGHVLADEFPLAYVNVLVDGTSLGTSTDSLGRYEIRGLQAGTYTLQFSFVGFIAESRKINLSPGESLTLNVSMKEDQQSLSEVVVTGTLKEITRMESSVPVEVYSPKFFRKNPTPNIYDALQNVNGVRPQLNCNICNTGDIHINGLEGPYTFVLIDGMPIVSGLSTVYGLSGIPNSLVERVEIVKGPASSLYGSEAVGGLVNIITKKPGNAPLLAFDMFGTTWQEYNLDLGLKLNVGEKATSLTGVNYYLYDNIMDQNNDNFTDVTLQDRISVFQKWSFNRKDHKLFTLAGRYYYENRWGGETQWNESHRGGDEVYGESIYTDRWELLGQYQLPTTEKLMLSFSFNAHDQDSRYGETVYDAIQRISFTQLSWDKQYGLHDLLLGAAYRHTFYDDNTPATARMDGNDVLNQPDRIKLPGVFIQDEVTFENNNKLLLGLRYDHNSRHGGIFTPRIGYKWAISPDQSLRFNAGTGFRVVNLFTEDHAALTGAREVIIANELKPEKSYNFNLNYLGNWYTNSGIFIGLDMSAFYTYFTNQILPDYETDQDQIIYDNIDGYAVTNGFSANLDFDFNNGFKLLAGFTYQDVFTRNDGVKRRQLLTERFSATWTASYTFSGLPLTVDYTGKLYSPMELPLLGELDPRDKFSPWWSLQNIQLTYTHKKVEFYGGVKNIFNWTPDQEVPFLIARSNDPFDKQVRYDNQGNVQATPNNPYALTFDPTYVYAPNQGIRGFFGIRFSID
ncbi:TonB-dependent receptor [Roseivirga sp.]|uniref:TonB-dependent receptor n=1 Tax=Roseivirga sp. TaxID=1964215 RepID=UPI003B51DBF7